MVGLVYQHPSCNANLDPREESHTWVPLNITGYVNIMARDAHVRVLKELHSMGRSGFSVGQWCLYNGQLEGAYEVSTLAPPAAHEPVHFMSTVVNRYRKIVRESREAGRTQGRGQTGGGSCAHSLTRSSNPLAARPSSGASTDRTSSQSE